MIYTDNKENVLEATNSKSLHADTNIAHSTRLDLKRKEFVTLEARYALAGHALKRSDPKDDNVTYWAVRWRLVRYLPTIDAVRQFLEYIGRRL